jgi:secreted trypsin-like serine protease
MDDDLNKKINQVAEMIKNDELPDNIKNIISMLSNDSQSDSDDSSSANSEKSSAQKTKSFSNDNQNNDEMAENIAMIAKIKKIMDKTNGAPDPKLNLLSALGPFLNGSRQDKLKNCMKIVKMTKLTEILKETDLF